MQVDQVVGKSKAKHLHLRPNDHLQQEYHLTLRHRLPLLFVFFFSSLYQLHLDLLMHPLLELLIAPIPLLQLWVLPFQSQGRNLRLPFMLFKQFTAFLYLLFFTKR